MNGGGGGRLPRSRASPQAFRQILVGHAYVKAPLALQLPLLSLGTLGAQAVWSIDMAFAPPYLLDLGLTKSAMAAVFVAGPLSGLVVQPLIGALADNSTSKHGRRRPLLGVGTVICCATVLMLSFAREIASVFSTSGSEQHAFVSIFIAVVAIYLIDFSVNVITALNRALMIDVASVEDQAAANAWAARLSGAGSVISFLIGNLDLPAILPTMLGTTQIQILSVITCFLVLSTHLTVIFLVQEQVLVRSRVNGNQRSLGLRHLFRDLFGQARNLPAPILEIFKIQFFAWIGWFPIMFYTTVWVGEIYRSGRPTPLSSTGPDELFEEATRVGSRAMFWHAVVAFVSSVLLPLIVPSPLGASPTAATPGFLRGLQRFRAKCPDLTFWWVFSHFIFCIAMMATYIASLAESVFFATLLVAMVGFCWCITSWVPFGLLGILIQHHTPEEHPMQERDGDAAAQALLNNDAERSRGANEDAHSENDSDDDLEAISFSAGPRSAGDSTASHHDAGGTSGHSGSILGLHNLAIVLPQFGVTLISAVIFAIMEPPGDPETPKSLLNGRATPEMPVPESRGDPVGLVLRLGGLSALVAGILAVRFARRYHHLLSA